MKIIKFIIEMIYDIEKIQAERYEWKEHVLFGEVILK